MIQPPVIRALTTKKERMIRMDYNEERASKLALILFPIIVTAVAGIIVPMSAPLVGSLMFGNLIRECGVLDRLSKTAQNELANLVTILLGITIGGTMVADKFLRVDTLLILALGLFAFVFDTAGGVLFAKLLNVFRKKKINPMVGAAGISAFPMSARVIQKMAKEEDPYNFILMQSISANVSGQLGSIVAGGMVISLVSMLLGGIWSEGGHDDDECESCRHEPDDQGPHHHGVRAGGRVCGADAVFRDDQADAAHPHPGRKVRRNHVHA